jgi:copper chaperone CopZ
VSVALGKLPGVDAVEVSLNLGLAKMRLQSDNTLTLERINRAVIDNGFTPKEAQVTVTGKFVPVDGEIGFQVSGAGTVYHVLLDPAAWATEEQSMQVEGKPYVVTGVIQTLEEAQPPIFNVSMIQEAG